MVEQAGMLRCRLTQAWAEVVAWEATGEPGRRLRRTFLMVVERLSIRTTTGLEAVEGLG